MANAGADWVSSELHVECQMDKCNAAALSGQRRLDARAGLWDKVRKFEAVWKNEDIAADVISFVRRLALGDPLVSHEDRILAMREWTKIQRQWLEWIELQLLKESVIDRQAFDQGAFKDNGGFNRIDRIFQGRLDAVLMDITALLYPEERKYA